jgi:acyl-homoserine lactone acylase PvdQ
MFIEYAAKATPADIEAAKAWYSEASELALSLTAIDPDMSFDQAACVIAALSIRQTWKKNVEYAILFALGETPPVMGAIVNILDNIMGADDPYSAMNGDKTNSFARNIAGDMEAVTLDVWMIRAAGMDSTKSLNKTQYREMSAILKDEALEYGMLPAVFQALVWIVIRGGAK